MLEKQRKKEKTKLDIIRQGDKEWLTKAGAAAPKANHTDIQVGAEQEVQKI